MIDEPIGNFSRRIIVAGTRDYGDYESFSNVIKDIVSSTPNERILFISGAAKTGADALIIRWCKENNHQWIIEFPAKWRSDDGTLLMNAGYVRNVQMSEVATELVCFYDGISKGTKHMIDIATKKKLSITIHLIEIIKDEKFTFFYGAENPLSQHYISYFTVKNIRFNCCEQFMMYCKAMYFKDFEIAEKILKEHSPTQQKYLGRKVKNFDEPKWIQKREHFVFIGNLNKFRQNPDLKKFLLDTNDTELVEASQNDCIWGVGLSESDPKIHDKKNWRGLNLLGKTQERVRHRLRFEIQ